MIVVHSCKARASSCYHIGRSSSALVRPWPNTSSPRIHSQPAEGEMLDVERDIEGEPLASRPTVVRPLDDRRIGISGMAGKFQHRDAPCWLGRLATCRYFGKRTPEPPITKFNKTRSRCSGILTKIKTPAAITCPPSKDELNKRILGCAPGSTRSSVNQNSKARSRLRFHNSIRHTLDSLMRLASYDRPTGSQANVAVQTNGKLDLSP